MAYARPVWWIPPGAMQRPPGPWTPQTATTPLCKARRLATAIQVLRIAVCRHQRLARPRRQVFQQCPTAGQFRSRKRGWSSHPWCGMCSRQQRGHQTATDRPLRLRRARCQKQPLLLCHRQPLPAHHPQTLTSVARHCRTLLHLHMDPWPRVPWRMKTALCQMLPL